MQANLAHFYIVLKQTDTVVFKDQQGKEHEGSVILINPKEQQLVFQNVRNLSTNEVSRRELVQFKDITHLKVQQQNNLIQEKSKSEKKVKTFVKWDQNVDESNLEDQTIKNFNQFEAIKRFGIDATYDENSYTTKLTTPITEDFKQYAESIEKDLKFDTTNSHVLEERNLKQQEDEDLAYSSVIREQPKQQNQQISQLFTKQKDSQAQKQQQVNIVQQSSLNNTLFYNSNKQKEQNIKKQYINQISQPFIIIPNEQEFQPKIKDVNNQNTTKFKTMQVVTQNVQKLIISNFINQQEGYKWQNMLTDPLKNKKEKFKK